MNEGVGPGDLPQADGRTHRHRWLPFWGVQATEIIVALVFADISVHVANGGLLIGGAIALFALAVTAQGPLGLFRICGQRLHLILAMALSVVIALAPLVPAIRPDIEGIIVVEFGAVGLFRVATLTRTGRAGPGRRATRPGAFGGSGRSGGSVIDATATVVGAGAGPAAGAGAAAGPRAGAGAGPRAGAGAEAGGNGATAHGIRGNAVSRPGGEPSGGGTTTGGRPPTGPTASGAAARWAGRASGAAVASGKQAVTNYRPGAEAQVKRTIRGMGKLAGRVSSRLTPPDDQTR